MTLADILRSYRAARHLTLADMAAKTSLSKPYLSMLENGRHSNTKKAIRPSVDTLERLAAGMDMDVETLMDEMKDIPHVLRETGELPERADIRKRAEALSRDLESGAIHRCGKRELTAEEQAYLRALAEYLLRVVELMEKGNGGQGKRTCSAS